MYFLLDEMKSTCMSLFDGLPFHSVCTLKESEQMPGARSYIKHERLKFFLKNCSFFLSSKICFPARLNVTDFDKPQIPFIEKFILKQRKEGRYELL